MELDPEELRSLARFIARRMGPEVVLDPADAPPARDAVEAWTALLEEARAQGRLDALIRRVAAHDPGDEALQEACRLLAGDGPQVRPVRLPRVAVAVALAALLTVGALVGPRLGPAPEPEPVRVELTLQPQSVAPTSDEAVEPVGSEAPAEALAAIGYVEADAAEALAAVGYVEPAAVPSVAAAPGPDAASGDCGARPGELVGYWYAGEQPPGDAGEVVVLSHAVNVRAAYPDATNRFDARAPVRCVLGAGSRVRLSKEPIPVPRESWWVPLISGDVLQDRTT